jgi:translation initiation factor 1 (eIF-1/SUI1)
MSKNMMKSAYVKPSNNSDSGESDSEQNLEQDTIVSNNQKAMKPKKVVFKKQSDYSESESGSDSESDADSDADSDTETNIKVSNSSSLDESINSNGANVSESVFNKSDLDTIFDTDLDTKPNTELVLDTNSDTNKTRKALKNIKRIQEQKKKMEEKRKLKANNSKDDDSDSEEKCSSFALDSLQHHNNMMTESIFSKIHIRCVQRNSRKSTTTIEGICSSIFEDNEKIKKILKALSRGTRATHKFDKETNTNIIEISGNKINNMIDVLCEHVECKKSQIVVHGVLA